MPEKTTILKDICALMFITALFTIARTWKEPRCPSTDEWVKTLPYTHTVEYCLLLLLVTKFCLTLLRPHGL